MAELLLQISVSLDGYIETRDGDIEWMASDASVDTVHTRTLQSIDGMIFGRKAHALLAQFWPDAADNPAAPPVLTEQARLMNALPKYVLTHGGRCADWANSHAITAEDVARLKRDATRPIALFAGAAAAQALLARSVVDEVRLIRYPVLLGGGTPLFAPGGPRRTLTLIANEAFESGATLQRFRVFDSPPSA